MIEETDAIMDLELDTGSLDAVVLRLISRTWTAYRCMLKDPTATGLGEFNEDRTEALRQLKMMLDEMKASVGDGMYFKYGYADLRWPVV